MFKPFSDNLIFFDTEFSSLDPREGEILSIGMVKMNGEKIYLEIDRPNLKCSEWVEKNVLPQLTAEKTSIETAKKKINDFIGDNKPYAISYVNQFDAPYLYKMISQDELLLHWIILDFASVLFSHGIDPAIISKENDILYEKLGIDHKKYKRHNALDDALKLKKLYTKLLEKNEINF